MGKEIFKRIKEYFYMLLKGLLDVIYPRESFCILCRKNETDYVICNSCKKKIKKCSKDDIAYGYYKGQLKTIILKFKFERDFNAGDVLVQFLAEKIDTNKYSNFYITYIPITKENYRKRGFNQCRYIALEVARLNNIKVIECLKLVKKIKIQKELSKEERRENIKGAFKIINRNLVYKKRILLIDDVMTTGATINEGKSVLIAAGASEVKQLVLARAEI